MPITPRERLARVLDGSQPPGAFSAQLSVPARDVRLTVAGAGPISFPVKAPQAKRMIASARPARFGRGERTLTDLSGRAGRARRAVRRILAPGPPGRVVRVG
jgi:hypothetical protein